MTSPFMFLIPTAEAVELRSQSIPWKKIQMPS